MSNYQYILVEHLNHVSVITLNRPAALNALNFQMVGELANALEACDRDDNIRCIVIAGAGDRAFAAGADIKEMANKTPLEMMGAGFAAWERLRHIKTPTIAAVHGYVLGAGCELALHCDMIIASEDALFGQPEISIGVIPGAGATQRLARTLGKFRTMEMVLTGVRISAQEMAQHGLVNRVVPKGEHLNAALNMAQTIAVQAPIAARLAKESVLAAFETSLSNGLEIERKNFFLLFSTSDMREGMQAFIEKRPPKFEAK